MAQEPLNNTVVQRGTGLLATGLASHFILPSVTEDFLSLGLGSLTAGILRTGEDQNPPASRIFKRLAIETGVVIGAVKLGMIAKMAGDTVLTDVAIATVGGALSSMVDDGRKVFSLASGRSAVTSKSPSNG